MGLREIWQHFVGQFGMSAQVRLSRRRLLLTARLTGRQPVRRRPIRLRCLSWHPGSLVHGANALRAVSVPSRCGSGRHAEFSTGGRQTLKVVWRGQPVFIRDSNRSVCGDHQPAVPQMIMTLGPTAKSAGFAEPDYIKGASRAVIRNTGRPGRLHAPCLFAAGRVEPNNATQLAGTIWGKGGFFLGMAGRILLSPAMAPK